MSDPNFMPAVDGDGTPVQATTGYPTGNLLPGNPAGNLPGSPAGNLPGNPIAFLTGPTIAQDSKPCSRRYLTGQTDHL